MIHLVSFLKKHQGLTTIHLADGRRGFVSFVVGISQGLCVNLKILTLLKHIEDSPVAMLLDHSDSPLSEQEMGVLLYAIKNGKLPSLEALILPHDHGTPREFTSGYCGAESAIEDLFDALAHGCSPK